MNYPAACGSGGEAFQFQIWQVLMSLYSQGLRPCHQVLEKAGKYKGINHLSIFGPYQALPTLTYAVKCIFTEVGALMFPSALKLSLLIETVDEGNLIHPRRSFIMIALMQFPTVSAPVLMVRTIKP